MILILSYIAEFAIQLFMLFLLTYVGNKLIKKGFEYIHEKKEDDGNKLGRHIGNAERILLCIGIITCKYELLTGVLALKALARFEKIKEDKTFSEYFLLGTSWSLIYSLAFSAAYGKWIGFFDFERAKRIQNFLCDLC